MSLLLSTVRGAGLLMLLLLNEVYGQQCGRITTGVIFPEYSRGPVEHALHWSKAQSKCRT